MVDGGQQEASQHCNYGDYNKQLNEGESRASHDEISGKLESMLVQVRMSCRIAIVVVTVLKFTGVHMEMRVHTLLHDSRPDGDSIVGDGDYDDHHDHY